MRRLPPDRHVECLAEDWVDLVPQRELHHLHPYDDATPGYASGRRFTNAVASPPALPSPPASSPDAWLALAEESMRPPRADAPARRARRAARLVRACATALEPRPRDGAPGARTTTEGKEQKEEPFEARARRTTAKTRVSATTRFYSSGVSASSASHERRPHRFSDARVAVAVAAVAAVAVVLFLFFVFFVSRVGRIPADAPRRVPDVEAYRSGYPGYGGLLSFPACKRHSRANEDAIASLRLALARTRANEDALRRNVTAADAAADAWHRASEAWYDAFTRAVETNAALSVGLKAKPLTPFWP